MTNEHGGERSVRQKQIVRLKGKPRYVTLPCGKVIRLDKSTGKGHWLIEVAVVEPELPEEPAA